MQRIESNMNAMMQRQERREEGRHQQSGDDSNGIRFGSESHPLEDVDRDHYEMPQDRLIMYESDSASERSEDHEVMEGPVAEYNAHYGSEDEINRYESDVESIPIDEFREGSNVPELIEIHDEDSGDDSGFAGPSYEY